MLTGLRRLGYERRRAERSLRCRGARSGGSPRPEVATLDRDGFVVLRGHTPQAAVDELGAELAACLRDPDSLAPVRDDAAGPRADGERPDAVVDRADVAAGPDRYRSRTNAVTVDEPLLRCPTALRLAFDPAVLDLASAYFRCPAAITGADLRHSFVNDLTGSGDLYLFHSDPNAFRIIKVFTYLNDVDEDGGPFLYVRGSHRDRPRGWTARYLWTRSQLEGLYGADRVIPVTGRAGDVILADTSGFHTGSKPRRRDRSTLIVNFALHKELKGRHPWLQVPGAFVDELDPVRRRAADFLRVEPSVAVGSP